MTQFALVFSAMIHDAGHTGVPNFVLAKENPEIASKYRGQSLAEQRSIDISFELLMAPVYKNLRDCIFGTNHTMGEEFQLFRQLVVNSVIATDIFDPTRSAARKARWDEAFNNPDKNDGNISMDEMDEMDFLVFRENNFQESRATPNPTNTAAPDIFSNTSNMPTFKK